MTAPGGVEVARASVRIVPDTSKTPEDLKTKLERIESTVRMKLPVSLGASTLVADARRLAKLAEDSAKVQLAALLDGKGLEQQAKAVTKKASEAAPLRVKPEVDPLNAVFTARLKSDVRKLAAELELNIPAGVQGELLRRQVSAQIKALERGLELEVPTRPAEAAEYRRRLQEQVRLVERTVTAHVPVEVDLEVPAQEKAEVAAEVQTTKRLLERNPVRIPLDIDTSSIAAVSRMVAGLGGGLAAAGTGAVAGQALAGGLVALASALAQTAGALALIPAAGAATTAVVATLRLGLSGLSDALEADTPAKYAAALAEISPEARVLVGALRELAPEFRKFRDAVQDRLLRGLSDDVRGLAEVYLPILERGLGGIADKLNAGAVDLGRFARSSESLRVLRTTLDDSARATGLLSEALVPAARGIRSLVDVGADFMPRLAAQVAVLAERWAVMLERSAEDGRLREWISQALDSIGNLAGIVGNVGRALGGVFRAGTDSGERLLDVVREITGQIAAFTNSTQGQDALGSFLGGAASLARALLPLLGSVVQVVGHQLAPQLASVGERVLPAITRAVDAVGRALVIAGPGIDKFADGLAAGIDGLVESGAVDALGELAGVIGSNLGAALERVGPKLGDVVTVLADELAEALPDLVPAAIDLALALGDLLIAASPLIGVVADLVGTVGLPTLQKVAEELTTVVGNLAEKFSRGQLDGHLEKIADAAADWLSEVGPLTDELVALGAEIVETLLPHLPELIRSSADLARSMVPIAKAAVLVVDGLSNFSQMIDELEAKIPGLKAVTGDNGIFGFLAGTTNPLIFGVKGLYDSVSGLTKIMQGEYPDAVTTFRDYTLRLGEGSRLTYEDIKRAGSESLLGLAELFRENAPIITDIFLNNLFAMESGQRTIFGQMLANVTDYFGRMDAEIAERTFGIADKVDAGMRRVAESHRREWDEAYRRTVDGVRAVASVTATLPGQVESSLGNIAGTLYPSGSSLIGGFVAGMRSQEYAARRAAASIMEAVAGFFPNSPARVGPFSGRGWTPYRGAELVTGFAEGMRSSIASTVQAANAVTRSVSDRLPTGADMATGDIGRGLPPITIPIDARGTDPEVVAELVPHRLRAALRR